jgi:hypothetical protein
VRTNAARTVRWNPAVLRASDWTWGISAFEGTKWRENPVEIKFEAA